MKKRTLIYTALLFGAIACQNNKITIHSDFECGTIGSIVQVNDTLLEGTTTHWLKRDSIGDQYYWFYFKLGNVANKNLAIRLKNLTGIYRGKTHNCYSDTTQPVFSYDQKTWGRIENVHYNKEEKTFIFQHHFENDEVYIAFAHPYTNSQSQAFINSVKAQPNVQIHRLAESQEGRSIDLIEVSNGENDRQKRCVFIQAVQHAGEYAGGYFAEGFTHKILDGSAASANALKKYRFFIVPMVNPDGAFHGVSRYNKAMADLNSNWQKDTIDQPEVNGVKQYILDMMAGGDTLMLFMDVHCHTQKRPRHIIFYYQTPLNEQFASLWSQNALIRKKPKNKITFPGSAAACMYNDYGINAMTMELSQAHPGNGIYDSINDYQALGASAAEAIFGL